MGEEDESKKRHAIFGSAGMAAAGMMSRVRLRKSDGEETGPASEEVKPDDSSEASEAPVETEPAPQSPGPEYSGWKGAVVGETGAGGFGAGMDLVFQKLDGVRLFGLADLNASKSEDSRLHAGAVTGYDSLPALLQKESPDLVSIASASTRDRKEQIRTVLESGAHVLCEAPFARTLKECDEILALEKTSKGCIAVRYPMRLDPGLQKFHAEMESLIGELTEIRAWGACGESAGGEDLLLVGVPLFDLIRWFAGEASYCTASISKSGVASIAEDSHESTTTDLGLLLGDTIHAEFEMESGVRVSFSSAEGLQTSLGPAGLEFIGTKSRMRLFAGARPVLSYLKNPAANAPDKQEIWGTWPKPEKNALTALNSPESLQNANRLVVLDWIDAASNNTEPTSSVTNALRALEMAHGVWQAGVTMKRAYFPLANRLHPLSEESQ